MGYIPKNKVFSTALGGNNDKFKYEMQKFLVRVIRQLSSLLASMDIWKGMCSNKSPHILLQKHV